MTPTELKRIRKELGLTQEQLAKQLGVGQNAVARWEIGLRRISEPTVRLLRRILAEVRGTAKEKGRGR
jgi:transcriptional regulator with XRE-family HTH domain